jgi:hypothetical protein
MATASLPTLPAESKNNILDIVRSGQGLLDIFAGKKTEGTQTSTTQTALSQEGIQALLNQILGGNQGLATVASGQKSAGLYNSTVHTLLANDLLSRAAGEVAVKGAPTTTSSKSAQQQVPQMDFGKTLLGLGVSALGSKALKASGASDKIDSVFKDIFGKGKKALPESADTEDASLGIAAGAFNGGNIADGGDFASSIVDSGFSSGGGGINILSNLGGSVGDLYPGAADSFLSSSAENFAGNAGDIWSDAASLGENAAENVGESVAENAIEGGISGSVPIIGPAIKLFQGDTAGAAGSAIGGAIGSTFGPVGTVVGSTIGSAIAGGSVICTECHYRGDMSAERYKASTLYGYNHMVARSGYHIWGVPAVSLMKRSKLFYYVARFLANSYAAHITGEGSLVGATIISIGYPICYTLGKIKQWLSRKSILAY